MDGVFASLLLVSLVGLVWGLVSPGHLGRTLRIPKPVTRLHAGLALSGLVLLFFVLTGIAAPSETPTASHISVSNSASHTQVQADTVVTKQETETKPVAFTTQTQDDSSLPEGQTKVVQAGVNGVETLTYNVTYTNGQQTSKTLVSDVVTTQPTEEIIADGTYVAPEPQPTPTPQPSPSCYPLTNGGNCYEPGEYCRNSDHGISGIAGDGEAITCAYNNGWRWEPQS